MGFVTFWACSFTVVAWVTPLWSLEWNTYMVYSVEVPSPTQCSVLLNPVISPSTLCIWKAFHEQQLPASFNHSGLCSVTWQQVGYILNFVQVLRFSFPSWSSIVQWPSSQNRGVSGVNITLCEVDLQSVSPGGSPPNLNCQLGTFRDWWWGIMIVYMLHFHPIFWCVLVMMLTVVWRSVTEIKAAAAAFLSLMIRFD